VRFALLARAAAGRASMPARLYSAVHRASNHQTSCCSDVERFSHLKMYRPKRLASPAKLQLCTAAAAGTHCKVLLLVGVLLWLSE
jgi:hypothetical protein